ncbi:ectonucleoside triphosphate diphosphohydrolase 5-like [Rhopalosiphum maidis]|uniref:ectonucleoside triphosphate diphosphohydrolase 5-like n=1 Tax=Rhopalosiphum maidis TaxID=43146 RepID=UPI000F0052E2|nr:ectonucleoside triphosphate diphosphohydrolase 5-like [Rhopalosiphum maidis]
MTTNMKKIIVEVNAEASVQKSNRKGHLYCAVIIDAGSTGSRILATAFKKIFIKRSTLEVMFCCSGFGEKYFELYHYIFQRTEGGLSQFIDDKQKRENIIRNLLEQAEDFMNENPRCGRTPLLLKATAGLRLLNEKDRDEIINQAKDIFNEYSKVFQVDENSVAIMDGDDEGLFAWFTVNYLLDNLQDFESTETILDLGGGSLQVTYYLPNYNLHHFFYNTKYVIERIITGKRRHFYNQSGANLSTHSIENYNKCWAAIQPIVVKTVGELKDKSINSVIAISFFYDVAYNAQLIQKTGQNIRIERFDEAAKGLGITKDSIISLDKFIGDIELSWALGAAYEHLIDEF